ncbi:23S rRNA (pseudouridine(1915)-N(3))-methyltransferase RlmH [Caproiciproducens galactitolivorans]|uniref:Ribosomal RNA large subunit methyltransferase H n=1 Tax=Caproiciproducens galactitolivorans TaxID=642589 RepID=A0A4Z0XZT1_9FIRM|nr:23S rRNA (pseudouridine(1915)-N(3))-methyltransferase RlmH [Caproiciproducens galactitolivorans]QEY33978.1 23S rRNA (pseudouridine(1915)-N(3))-methyltransferase RlmH [Caproiciproducens galactitolivorans]TGJ76057.1 ribosomal RNA large subunit methyltransferase H [Caproiciproducens galactitolivorans]
MLNIRIICVGKLKEPYWRQACAEYEKRLHAFCSFSICEISESRLQDNPSNAQIAAALQTEGEKILSAAGNSFLFALCIEGRVLSSEQLAEKIDHLAVNGNSTISFLIGSSFGLSEELKKKADFKLSMSPMTFPHQLARVMVCEQIYRAFQINSHGKYHK